jgi:hypothetical protein
MVVLGATAVTVALAAPKKEHALECWINPEQADA